MAEWGLTRQEQGSCCRKPVAAGVLRALGWEEAVSRRYEAREAEAESPVWHTIVLGKRVQAVQAR